MSSSSSLLLQDGTEKAVKMARPWNSFVASNLNRCSVRKREDDDDDCGNDFVEPGGFRFGCSGRLCRNSVQEGEDWKLSRSSCVFQPV